MLHYEDGHTSRCSHNQLFFFLMRSVVIASDFDSKPKLTVLSKSRKTYLKVKEDLVFIIKQENRQRVELALN